MGLTMKRGLEVMSISKSRGMEDQWGRNRWSLKLCPWSNLTDVLLQFHWNKDKRCMSELVLLQVFSAVFL